MSIGELHDEMAKRGFHYGRTVVARALIDLVKVGVLNREGRPRRYQYVQKRTSVARRRHTSQDPFIFHLHEVRRLSNIV
jgi:hypothetical protein